MLQLHDVVRIKDLKFKEDEWNGTLALCISDEYVHPRFDKLVVKIKIRDTLWAIEVANVEKVNEAERLHYFRNLDGNQVVPWEQCHWQPKERKQDGPSR
jgi:hypothetical protein